MDVRRANVLRARNSRINYKHDINENAAAHHCTTSSEQALSQWCLGQIKLAMSDETCYETSLTV